MLVTKENAKIGLKVKKSKNFRYGNQGGKSTYGTIMKSSSYFPENKYSSWVRVKWENGSVYSYELDRDLILNDEKTNIELIAL